MIKIERVLSMTKVRNLCIDRGFYTAGDNEDYSTMLQAACQADTDEAVIKIAEDIIEHSDNAAVEESGGLTNIVWLLASTCTDIWVQDSEEKNS